MGLRRGRWELEELLLRLAGSIWLLRLQASDSVFSRSLLHFIGDGPWQLGWDRLWHAPSIYWCCFFHRTRSPYGPLIYVGETEYMSRRVQEHITRLCAVHGCTQQPFFDVVRTYGKACSQDATRQIKVNICEWLFVPLFAAPSVIDDRKQLERDHIHCVGTLNPPIVYRVLSFLRSCGKSNRSILGQRFFRTARPLMRLRGRPKGSSFTSLAVRKARCTWKTPLQKVGAAISGHRVDDRARVLSRLWSLTKGEWLYLVHRVDRFEESWRRKRGLMILKRVAKKRPDLCLPVSLIRCSSYWVGASIGRQIVLQGVRQLFRSWRASGLWLPVCRHARFAFSWVSGPSLIDLLSTASSLRTLVVQDALPSCQCASRLLANPSWPNVTLNGVSHIAAPQGRIPWPAHLQHLARWPASTTLAPTEQDIASLLRDCFRKLRVRCGIKDDGRILETVVADITERLWAVASSHVQSVPISRADAKAARIWLKDFYIQFFDHNTARIGVFCKQLVRDCARRALDFGEYATATSNIVWCHNWSREGDPVLALRDLAFVPRLSRELQPHVFTSVSRSAWQLGIPSLLPKWKAIGTKWRLLINKRLDPCGKLHSATCRAIDTVLNLLPRHEWSDYNSVHDLMPLCADFNRRVQGLFVDPIGWTEPADMADCFHHLPVADCVIMWRSATNFFSGLGVQYVSVPPKSCQSAGRLGCFYGPGWTVMSFCDIELVLAHYHDSNYISLPGWLGRERHGAPMGGALSNAVLRLWKWYRELSVRQSELLDTVRYPDCCTQLVHLQGVNVLALDVSFRDDVRIFCAWERRSGLSSCTVHEWAWKRLATRFNVGSMVLEESDPGVFTGLLTRWRSGLLVLSPRFSDPWGATTYDELDNSPLKPWRSWMPSSHTAGIVRGMLCRCVYLSNEDPAREVAMFQALYTLAFRAGYPVFFLSSVSRRWGRTWSPRSSGAYCRVTLCAQLERVLHLLTVLRPRRPCQFSQPFRSTL